MLQHKLQVGPRLPHDGIRWLASSQEHVQEGHASLSATVARYGSRRSRARRHPSLAPQQLLYLFPDPHGQGPFRDGLRGRLGFWGRAGIFPNDLGIRSPCSR